MRAIEPQPVPDFASCLIRSHNGTAVFIYVLAEPFRIWPFIYPAHHNFNAIAIFQLMALVDRTAIHFRTDIPVSNLGMNAISEVYRRRTFLQANHMPFRSENKNPVLQKTFWLCHGRFFKPQIPPYLDQPLVPFPIF